MPDPIRFYFELVSPYSYLASLRIEPAARAAGRAVAWRPIDLPKVWQAQGVLEAYIAIRKLKAPHVWRDSARCAERLGVTMKRPREGASIDTGLAKRAYWGLCETGDMRAKAFLQAVWKRRFAEGGDISTLADIAEAAAPLGLTAAEIEDAGAMPQAALRQTASNEEAIASGCFGVPWFIAQGEAFFGHDRVPHLLDFLTLRP